MDEESRRNAKLARKLNEFDPGERVRDKREEALYDELRYAPEWPIYTVGDREISPSEETWGVIVADRYKSVADNVEQINRLRAESEAHRGPIETRLATAEEIINGSVQEFEFDLQNAIGSAANSLREGTMPLPVQDVIERAELLAAMIAENKERFKPKGDIEFERPVIKISLDKTCFEFSFNQYVFSVNVNEPIDEALLAKIEGVIKAGNLETAIDIMDYENPDFGFDLTCFYINAIFSEPGYDRDIEWLAVPGEAFTEPAGTGHFHVKIGASKEDVRAHIDRCLPEAMRLRSAKRDI